MVIHLRKSQVTRTCRDGADVEVDVLPARQRVIESAETLERGAAPNRAARLPWALEEQKTQQIVAEQFRIQLSAKVAGSMFKNACLERREIQLCIPLHNGDTAGEAFRHEQIIGIEKNNEIGAALPDAEVAADIGAGLFTCPLHIADAWIGLGTARHFLRRAVIRSVIHDEVLPRGKSLCLPRIHRLAQKLQPVFGWGDDRNVWRGVHAWAGRRQTNTSR